MLDLLPDGAWLAGGMDFEFAKSQGQLDNERKALADPSSIKNANGGCSIPAMHAALAAYGHDEFAIVTRGVFRVDAMTDCLAHINPDATVTHETIAGHDVLSSRKGTDKPMMFVVSETGLVIAASEPEMKRVLTDNLRSRARDPQLAALIAQARTRGEIWAAARFPRGPSIADDVLGMIGAKLTGRLATMTAAIHFTEPYRIEVEIEVEQEADATALGAALVQKQHELADSAPSLGTVLDALSVTVDHNHVRLVANPAKIDWMQALQAFIGVVAKLRN